MATERTVIRVGSRKSELALIQTHHVIGELKKRQADLHVEIETMTTTGDKILDTALSKIGEKSLFTKELEIALEDKRVDFVVHSLKDLPTTLPDNMMIGAVLKREDPNDAVIMHPKFKTHTLETLPKDSIIGTSSLRRAAQLKRRYPHLKFESIRGNLNTRLRKLDQADVFAALILAAAGVKRMGWQERITQYLEPEDCMYAIGQGALAIECRSNDLETLSRMTELNHYDTMLRCIAERSFLKTLEGGCSVPVAVHSIIENETLTLKGGVFSIDGTESVIDSKTTSVAEEDEPSPKKPKVNCVKQFSCIASHDLSHHALQAAEDLGKKLAEKMIEAGAGKILNEAKRITAEEIMKQKAEKEKFMEEKLRQEKLAVGNGHSEIKTNGIGK